MLTASPAAPYLLCHAPNLGAIPRYHLDTAAVDAVLDSLKAGGADGISLSPFFLRDAAASGNQDLFLDPDQPQSTTNLTALVATIRAKGFNWLQFAPQFYGPNDPRQNPYSDNLFQQNWNLIVQLMELGEAFGRPFLVDVCPEVNGGGPGIGCYWRESADFRRYATNLWIDSTAAYYPNGRPAFAVSMSFIPDNLDALPDIFLGNPPAILVPHIYRGEQQAVFDAIKAAGLGGRHWVVGECMSLTGPEDQPILYDWASFIESTKQPVQRFCPWQIDPRVPRGSAIQISVTPPAAPWRWNLGLTQ